MENISEFKKMLFLIYKGLKHWELLKWGKVPASLYEGQMLMIKSMVLSNRQPPTNLYDFIQLLYKPFESWGIKAMKDLFPLDASFLIEGYGVSAEIEDFIDMYISPEENDQSVVKQILIYCREGDLDNEYRTVRLLLSNKKNAVITAFKLKQLLDTIKDETLRQMVKKCYEEILQPIQNYRKCPHCGWTLSYQNGRWLCNKESICRYFTSFERLERFSNEYEDSRVYRLIPGIQRYTLLTGIIENEIFMKLKKYDSIIYPEIDRYDIAITTGGRTIHIDVKDYKSPVMLAHFFNEKPQNELEKYQENVFVLVPNYRVKQQPGYITQFKKKLDETAKPYIQIISERDFYKSLKEGTF